MSGPESSPLAEAAAKAQSWDNYRLAKAARGLSKMEKRALIFIADAQTMRDGVCKKSKRHAEDFGTGQREFQYGVHGRKYPKARGGGVIFPGLLARGIVTVSGHVKGGRTLGGEGMTPVYTINPEVLLTFCPNDFQPEPDDAKKGEQKGEHMGEHNGEHKGEHMTPKVFKVFSLPPNIASTAASPLRESAAEGEAAVGVMVVAEGNLPAIHPSSVPAGRLEGTVNFNTKPARSFVPPETGGSNDRSCLEGKEKSEPRPTTPHERRPEIDITVEPRKVKSAGRKNHKPDVEMSKRLQRVYDVAREIGQANGDWNEDMPWVLSAKSRPALYAAWQQNGCSIESLCKAFRRWIYDRYIPSFESGAEYVVPIEVPFALFANEFVTFLSSAGFEELHSDFDE